MPVRTLALGLVLALSSVARASEAPAPRPALSWQNAAALRVNPLGLFNETRLGVRHWLHDGATSPLLQNSYAGGSGVLFVSPGLLQAGADLEAAPLAILQLSAGYRLVGYFGTFGMQQGYAAASDWSDRQRSDESARGSASLGHLLHAGALVQLRAGDVVVRSAARIYWQRQDLGGDPQVFYDPVLDVLQPQGGLSLVNDADLLWLASDRWTVGLRHNFSQSFLDVDRLSGATRELADASAFQQRLGPLIGFRLEPDPARTAPAPALYLLLQAHLTHRFRTGERDGAFAPEAGSTVSQAVPYVGLAYRVAGDL